MPRRNAPAGFLFSKVYPTRFSQTATPSFPNVGPVRLAASGEILNLTRSRKARKEKLFCGSTALCGAAPPPAILLRRTRLPVIPANAALMSFQQTPPSCHSDERSEEESLRPFPASQTCSTRPRCPVCQRCFTAFNMTPGNVIPTNAPPISFWRTPPSCHSDERSEEESLCPFPASQTCSTAPRCPVCQRCFTAFNMTPGNVIPTNAPPISFRRTPPSCHS